MKYARTILLAGVLALASLYIGVRTGTVWQRPAAHPLTGRQIAGIATDATWMDRSAREQEEAPAEALALIGIAPGMVVVSLLFFAWCRRRLARPAHRMSRS